MPVGVDGHYLAARLTGRLVAGIAQAPDSAPTALWSTHIRVESIAEATSGVTSAGGSIVTGVLDASPDGRLALVSDPTGVAFGLWQPEERMGAELVNEPGTWAMSALHTPSVDRAAAFYGAVFGWQLEAVPDSPLAFWRLPGYVGGEPWQTLPSDVVGVVTPIDATGEVPPHWAVNFRVNDVDATAEDAIALGGQLLLPPTDTPGLRSALIADPQQGVIAITATANP